MDNSNIYVESIDEENTENNDDGSIEVTRTHSTTVAPQPPQTQTTTTSIKGATQAKQRHVGFASDDDSYFSHPDVPEPTEQLQQQQQQQQSQQEQHFHNDLIMTREQLQHNNSSRRQRTRTASVDESVILEEDEGGCFGIPYNMVVVLSVLLVCVAVGTVLAILRYQREQDELADQTMAPTISPTAAPSMVV